jgi:type III secretion system FlhB-like substrate exporter
MTKEEAKREHKEEEGDPMLKGRRKKRARELAKNRIAIEVPKADAVIVNPTHIAIAIRYRKDEGNAPRVIAKGKGVLAENIRELARAHGIPIVEDIALARLLYKRVKVGKSVPADTFRAVAAILAFVYRVTGRAPQAPARPAAPVGPPGLRSARPSAATQDERRAQVGPPGPRSEGVRLDSSGATQKGEAQRSVEPDERRTQVGPPGLRSEGVRLDSSGATQKGEAQRRVEPDERRAQVGPPGLLSERVRLDSSAATQKDGNV